VGRTLSYIGLVVLAGAAWFLVAGEAGWISAELSDQWFLPLAKVGGIGFAAGLLLGFLTPAIRRIRQGRCVRCGAATERGQSYCLDHLQETVREAQDETRRAQTLRRM
jgi:predicted nucleic acid-binding Zn ribbon protein